MHKCQSLFTEFEFRNNKYLTFTNENLSNLAFARDFVRVVVLVVKMLAYVI